MQNQLKEYSITMLRSDGSLYNVIETCGSIQEVLTLCDENVEQKGYEVISIVKLDKTN